MPLVKNQSPPYSVAPSVPCDPADTRDDTALPPNEVHTRVVAIDLRVFRLRVCELSLLRRHCGDIVANDPQQPVDLVRAVHLPHSAAARSIQHPFRPTVRTVRFVPDVVCHDYGSEIAAIDDALHRPDRRIVPLRVRGHQLDAVLFGSRQHLFGFRRPDRGRLLHVDVLASSCGVECGLVVEPVRERADDDVDIVTFERLAVVGDEIDVGVPILPRCGDILSRLGDDFDLGAGGFLHDVDVVTADAAGAEHRDSKGHGV